MQIVNKDKSSCPDYTRKLKDMAISKEKAMEATSDEIQSIRQAMSRLKKQGYEFESCMIEGKFYIWRNK